MPTQKHCGIHIRIIIIEYFTKKTPREEKEKRKISNSGKDPQVECRYVHHWSSLVSNPIFCHSLCKGSHITIFSNNRF